MSQWLTRIGFAMLYLGFAAIVGIFGTVIIMGRWPDFLEPARSWFELTHRFLGPFSYILALGAFVFPGWLLLNIADAFDPESPANRWK